MQLKFVVFLLEWHGWKWDSYINLSGILNGMARLDSSIWVYIVYNEIQMATMLCYYYATHCYRMLQAATGCYRFIPNSYKLVHKGELPHRYHCYRVYIVLLIASLFFPDVYIYRVNIISIYYSLKCARGDFLNFRAFGSHFGVAEKWICQLLLWHVTAMTFHQSQ